MLVLSSYVFLSYKAKTQTPAQSPQANIWTVSVTPGRAY